MAGRAQPLDDKFAIVGPDGRPTLYFIKWAQQRQIDITDGITLTDLTDYLAAHTIHEGVGIQITPSGNLTDGPIIAADVQEILDSLSATRGASSIAACSGGPCFAGHRRVRSIDQRSRRRSDMGCAKRWRRWREHTDDSGSQCRRLQCRVGCRSLPGRDHRWRHCCGLLGKRICGFGGAGRVDTHLAFEQRRNVDEPGLRSENHDRSRHCDRHGYGDGRRRIQRLLGHRDAHRHDGIERSIKWITLTAPAARAP
jgi:hypothetical protein